MLGLSPGAGAEYLDHLLQRAVPGRVAGQLAGTGAEHAQQQRGQHVRGDIAADQPVGHPPAQDFTHRRDGEAEIYFVRNRQPKAVRAKAVFRVTGRQPELWDAVTGEIRDAASWSMAEQGTEVDLSFAPHGSVFVVFRRPAPAQSARMPATTREPETFPIHGPWSVDFPGGPSDVAMPALLSWTRHPNPEIRYFAGSARYRTSFDLPDTWRQRKARLDLGRLWAIGEAWLNGQPLGVLWTPPFEADVTKALRAGSNELVVEVTNTWHNRLVGDAALPASQRRTKTNITVSGGKSWKESELLESGLFGPVRLVAAE